MIISGDYTSNTNIDTNRPSQISISPDGKLVAVSQDKTVNLFSVLTGQMLAAIVEPHSQPIVKVLFSADGQYLFTAGDKHIRIFHNVPGIEINIQELKETLKRNLSNSAAKERIEKQIVLAEESLKKILST